MVPTPYTPPNAVVVWSRCGPARDTPAACTVSVVGTRSLTSPHAARGYPWRRERPAVAGGGWRVGEALSPDARLARHPSYARQMRVPSPSRMWSRRRRRSQFSACDQPGSLELMTTGDDYSGLTLQDRVSGLGAGILGAFSGGLAIVFVGGVALIRPDWWPVLCVVGASAGVTAAGLAVFKRRSGWTALALEVIVVALLIAIAYWLGILILWWIAGLSGIQGH
jgi:hypothetical protein